MFHRTKSLIKIGIKQQLIVLVLFVALFCLIVLAILTGVYFSSSYRSVRSDRLQIVAQMKASQLQQSLNTLYYQVYWLSSRDSLQKSLVSYRAGNTTSENFYDAADTIRQFLLSTATVVSVKLYESSAHQVYVSPSNWSSSYVPQDVINQLYSLDFNMTFTNRNLLNSHGIVEGPLINSSTNYVMSMSVPIFTTPSILYDSSDLVGYITCTMSADSISTVVEDETTFESSKLRIISTNSTQNIPEANLTYKYVLPEDIQDTSSSYSIYKMTNNSVAKNSLYYQKTGYDLNPRGQFAEKVVGYCPVDFALTNWAAVVEQSRSTFMYPQNKLTKITVGCCLGIAVFIVAMTFPLAHWAVKPILRLQKATESIVEGRGLQRKNTLPRNQNGGTATSAIGTSTSGGAGAGGSAVSEKSTDIGSRDRGSMSVSSYSEAITHTNTFTTEHSSIRDGQSSSLPHHSTYISNARVPTYTRIFHDELSKLTETFNAMTDELDVQYSQLEHRVKARTKQLETAKLQAEAANEAKTVFIANISHELRTPLNGILGMTAIAMDETDTSAGNRDFDAEKVRQSLKLIFRSGELLLHILTELLTFSKNSLKRSKLERSDFVLLEVAQQINSIFGKLARDQKIRLSIIMEPLPEIKKFVLYGDSNRIIQVVMNLVSNALKFTPVDGDVKVRMKCCGTWDESRSEAVGYKEVYVVGQTKARVEDEDEKKFTEGGVSPFNETLEDGKITEVNDDAVIDDDDNDDTHSIITASTASYDKNIFAKQFKQPTINGNASTGATAPSAAQATPEPSPFATGSAANSTNTTTYQVFEFTIQDTGPGIEPSLHEAIFDPFIQGDQTLSRQYGGTGLGLSICRQLAEMMHGIMIMRSVVGKGSWFCFRVPLEVRSVKGEAECQNAKGDWEDFDGMGRKGRKVMIVDPKDEDVSTSTDSETDSAGGSHENNDTQQEEPESYFDRKILQSTGTANMANSIYSTHSTSNPGTPGAVHSVVMDPSSSGNGGTEVRPQPTTHSSIAQSTNTLTTITTGSSASTSTAAKNSTTHRPLKILVAEDNIVNQEVIKRMLTLEGLTDITMANNGQEAIDHIQSITGEVKQFDIIFMDVQMPLIDGLQATKVITQQLHFTNPIVALTAFADESNVKGCIDAGMTGFLSKPIRRALLRRILEEFCPEKEDDGDDTEERG